MSIQRNTYVILLAAMLALMMIICNPYYISDVHIKKIVVQGDILANVNGSDFRKNKTTMQLWQRQLCHQRKTPLNMERKPGLIFDIPMISRDIVPKKSTDNIFLVETSCNPQPSFREWCSVESWANQNPKKPVWYLVTSPFMDDQSGLLRDLRASYPNLKLVGCDMSEIMSTTPLKNIFESNIWFSGSQWPPVNLSDMVRYLLIWMFGGIYSDTDAICIKDTRSLVNVVGLESNGITGNAVLHGHPQHEIFWELMNYVSKNFKGNEWGVNGPLAVTEVVKKQCNLTKIKPFSSVESKCNVTILPQSSFYPIQWPNFNEYFRKRNNIDILKIFPESYALHFWNHKSEMTPTTVSSNSIMETAARRFCPMTFNVATKYSNFF